MNEIYDFGERDRMLDEASKWIARLDRGLSPDEESELREFLRNPAARTQFLDLARHWDKLAALSRLADIVPVVESRPSRLHAYVGAAAGVLVFLALLVFGSSQVIQRSSISADTAVVYETAVGEQSTLQLPDASSVVMNTNTRIAVTYDDSGRYVELLRGEIHVSVSRDVHRPFTVRADDQLIQAVGTEFNVYVAVDGVELIVVEGAVRVAEDRRRDRIGKSRPPGLLAAGTTVEAGSIGIFDASGDAVSAIDAADVDAELSWRSGSLVFRGESLAEVVDEISRYTNIDFVVLNDDILDIEIGGHYRAGDVSELLESLQANFGVTYQRVGDDRVLLSRR